MASLANIKPSDIVLPVSEYIDSIVSFIGELIKYGLAYCTKSGNVQGNIHAFVDFR